jgi:hypothetical protein
MKQKMETISNEELIMRLIKDSLINTKLISGLNSLGLIADDYTLFLGETIFLLMGFEAGEQSDLIFDKVYLALSEKVSDIKFSDSMQEVEILSKEIYDQLLFAKGVL